MAKDPGRVLIFDTTLRDGEQSPGASLNLEEKLARFNALCFHPRGDWNCPQNMVINKLLLAHIKPQISPH